MNAAQPLILHLTDWLHLAGHCALLSLLSVGGAISVMPEMHRYLVVQQHWLTEAQFTSSIALAQAAPGPNVLFAGLMGWNIGISTGSLLAGLGSALLTLGSMLLPSSVLAFYAARWSQKNRDLPTRRAFNLGMGPLVIALMFSAGWVLISAHDDLGKDWPLWLLSVAAALIIWRTKIHLLWLLGVGALLGWFGLV